MDSRWIPCASQGLAVDFLAVIYPGKFDELENPTTTDLSGRRLELSGYQSFFSCANPMPTSS